MILPFALRAPGFFRLDERNQVGDGLLHHPRALYNLRQEHLSGTEQVAHDVHRSHQRTLDHIERPIRGEARFFGVGNDERVYALHERVAQPLFDRRLPPFRIVGDRVFRARRKLSRDRQQLVGRVRSTVQHDILDPIAQ